MEDETNSTSTFALDVLVGSFAPRPTIQARLPLRLPAVALRFLDFPSLIVRSVTVEHSNRLRAKFDALTPRDGLSRADEESLLFTELLEALQAPSGEPGSISFNRGKSTVFKMSLSALRTRLRSIPLYLMITDVWDEQRPAVLASSSVNIAVLATRVHQSTPGSAVEEGRVPVLSMMGEEVGTLTIRVRLSSLGTLSALTITPMSHQGIGVSPSSRRQSLRSGKPETNAQREDAYLMAAVVNNRPVAEQLDSEQSEESTFRPPTLYYEGTNDTQPTPKLYRSQEATPVALVQAQKDEEVEENTKNAGRGGRISLRDQATSPVTFTPEKKSPSQPCFSPFLFFRSTTTLTPLLDSIRSELEVVRSREYAQALLQREEEALDQSPRHSTHTPLMRTSTYTTHHDLTPAESTAPPSPQADLALGQHIHTIDSLMGSSASVSQTSMVSFFASATAPLLCNQSHYSHSHLEGEGENYSQSDFEDKRERNVKGEEEDTRTIVSPSRPGSRLLSHVQMSLDDSFAQREVHSLSPTALSQDSLNDSLESGLGMPRPSAAMVAVARSVLEEEVEEEDEYEYKEDFEVNSEEEEEQDDNDDDDDEMFEEEFEYESDDDDDIEHELSMSIAESIRSHFSGGSMSEEGRDNIEELFSSDDAF